MTTDQGEPESGIISYMGLYLVLQVLMVTVVKLSRLPRIRWSDGGKMAIFRNGDGVVTTRRRGESREGRQSPVGVIGGSTVGPWIIGIRERSEA